MDFLRALVYENLKAAIESVDSRVENIVQA